MRPTREITAEEENWRAERVPGTNCFFGKRDPVEREPIGTIILMPFRIAGYHPDCDGSLMAMLEAIDKDGEETGWMPTHIGIYPTTSLVVTPEELAALFNGHKELRQD